MNTTVRSEYSDDFEAADVSMLTGDEDIDNINGNGNDDDVIANNNNGFIDEYDNENFESDGDSILLFGKPIEYSISKEYNKNTNYNKNIRPIESDNKISNGKDNNKRSSPSPTRDDIVERKVAFSADTDLNKNKINNKLKIKKNKDTKTDDYIHITSTKSTSSKDIFDSKYKLQIGIYPDNNNRPETNTPRSYNGSINHSPINKIKVNITSDDPSIHPQHVLKKQLDTALKKIQLLSKERAILMDKLDADHLGQELDKMRDTIAQQDRLIKKLKSDNYGLSLITRNQARLLSKDEQEEGANIGSNEGHVKILLERVRRLGNHLNASKLTERKAIEDFERVKKLYTASREQAERREKVIATLYSKLDQNSVSELSQSLVSNESKNKRYETSPLKNKKFLNNNYSDPNRGIEASLALELSEIENVEKNESKKANYISVGSASITTSKDQEKTSRTQKADDSAHVVEKLQKAIRVQRVGYTNEINNLKGQIAALKNENVKLRDELDEREKEGRMHVIQVRQLRKKYDDLVEGNKRLKAASNVYSNMERIQIPAPNPKPPSVPSTRSNSFRNPKHQRAPPVLENGAKNKIQDFVIDDSVYDYNDEENIKSDIITEQYSDEFTEYDDSVPPNQNNNNFFITSN